MHVKELYTLVLGPFILTNVLGFHYESRLVMISQQPWFHFDSHSTRNELKKWVKIEQGPKVKTNLVPPTQY